MILIKMSSKLRVLCFMLSWNTVFKFLLETCYDTGYQRKAIGKASFFGSEADSGLISLYLLFKFSSFSSV